MSTVDLHRPDRPSTRPSRRLRRPAAVVVAATTVLSLGACGDGVAPGAAAQVDGEVITLDQVDDLARVICATQGDGQSGEKSPTASVRGLALNVLLGIEVADQVAGLDSADPQQVKQGTQGVEQARAALPRKYLPLFDEIVRDSARAQIVMTDAAAREVQAAGGNASDQQSVAQAAAQLQADYVAEHDVEVASRFGTIGDGGQLTAGDGSLSVAVSDTAKSFVGSPQDPSGAGAGADYPDSQRCR